MMRTNWIKRSSRFSRNVCEIWDTCNFCHAAATHPGTGSTGESRAIASLAAKSELADPAPAAADFRGGIGSPAKERAARARCWGTLQPYRPLLEARTRSYVAVDLQTTPLVNVGAAAEALPFRDEQFDFVICTQVLEYLPNPAAAVAEIRRVLCKGGHLFLSAPSVFPRTNEKNAGVFCRRAYDTCCASLKAWRFEPKEIASPGFSGPAMFF